MLDGAEEVVQHVQGSLGIAGIAEGLGPAQGALARLVAGLFRQLVAFDGFREMTAGEERLGRIEVRHRPAIGLFEHLGGPIVAAQKEQRHTQPHHAGGGLLFLRLQLVDRVSETLEVRVIFGNRFPDLFHLGGAKGTIEQYRLLDVEFHARDHRSAAS